MGQSMVSSPYVVLSAIELYGKAMVDHSEAEHKAISRIKQNGNNLKKNFWTEILAAKNLESPGYHETIKEMNRLGLIKNKLRNINVG